MDAEAFAAHDVHNGIQLCLCHRFGKLKDRQRRQDLEPAFLETGAIYAMATAAFRQSGSRFCAPWQPVVIDDAGPEIDTPADLALCRSLAALTAG